MIRWNTLFELKILICNHRDMWRGKTFLSLLFVKSTPVTVMGRLEPGCFDS